MGKTHSVTIDPTNIGWMTATGKLPVPFINDYLFCAMLQKNNLVLRSLICSLLHMTKEEVYSIEITNPIDLGEHIDEKAIILDIKLILNTSMIIDLEMQVVNEHNWPERSLLYLCRIFSGQLPKGAEYIDAKPAIQIGFLDFTPFPEYPEFFANYYMINQKNQHVFSDKFRISVLSLNQIELATEEDKAYHIDAWAHLFKCKDWREVQMLAKNNPDIQEAVTTIYQLTEDEKTRQMCERREKALLDQRSREHKISQLTSKNEQLTSEKNQLASKNEQLTSENEQLTSEKNQLASENEQLTSEKEQLVSEVEQLKKLLKENNIDLNKK